VSWELFESRLASGWLVTSGEDVSTIAHRKLEQWTINSPAKLLVCTSNSSEFIAELMVGCKLGIPIFLCNPQWGSREWKQVEDLTNKIDKDRYRHHFMIPTGGSSGKIKFAMHTWQTLSESVWGFQEFYELDRINSVCTLPLYHVSGLMQVMRSLLTDGNLIITNFKQLCDCPPILDASKYFISLVPTQLEKLLSIHPEWLTNFHTILLGGAPPDRALLDLARAKKIPIALTYGMTETASQITSLQPRDFLAGNNSSGRVLPHAKIKILETGTIAIEAKSLMLGYFPHFSPDLDDFCTDDIGQIDEGGYLTIIGRNSGKIITGGENVFPLEVIQAILDTKLVKDVWVLGLPDRYWGEVVTAIYVPKYDGISAAQLTTAIADKLSKYKIPKSWIPITEIPRNSLGKIDLLRLTSALHF
jgi:o-succinylbenzoate---CoA ligase